MTFPHRPTIHATVLRRSFAALLVLSCFTSAQAVPTTPQVVNGQATFTQNGNVFSITNTPNTVINWQSFSINAGELTRFIQQSSDSSVLNRIVGQDPSQILGALQSNGHVFLINPNGILFGRDSRIDVNGLTASTLGLSDANFLAGKQHFGDGSRSGAIVNQGSITTPSGGRVFLIASNVENSGIITSPKGQVVLAAGHTVQLVDSANPSLHVVVSATADQSVNLGQIIAQGGKVGIYGALVNQRGVVSANSAQLGENGKIVLRASRDAVLEAGSLTSATGAGKGGEVSVEGVRVGMLGNAGVDVSGASGGGGVFLGGGYQGGNPLIKHAQQTMLGKNAWIRADATETGPGGKVVLWSDGSTRALGSISARGGRLGGSGGLVETSGKYLDVNGIKVQAGAPRGANGAWLLDPYDIEIVATGGESMLSDADQFNDPVSNATINASTIDSVAPGTNLFLQAQHDVTFSAGIKPALGTGFMTVDAGNSIFVNAPIETGGGAVFMTANHPDFASQSGAITFNAAGSLDTGGGSVTLNGTQVTLGAPLTTRNGNVTINGGGFVGFDQDIATGTGHLTVTANSIAFGGGGTKASGGFMSFNNMGGTFTLGANWKLESAESVNLYADNMSLAGSIGASQGNRPVVSMTSYTPGRPIDLVSGVGRSNLSIDPVALARFDAASINIGNPGSTSDITVLSPYGGGKTSKLVFQTQGNIAVNAPINMPSGKDSGLLLLLSGANKSGSITTAADVALPNPIQGGGLSAGHIELRANNISIGAPIKVGDGQVSLSPHTQSAQISVGAGAADGVDMLGLQDSELKFISGRGLQIGGNDGQIGGLTVTPGGIDLSANLPEESELRLIGGFGTVNLKGNVVTSGFLFMDGRDLQTVAGASAKAQGMRLQSHVGVGSDLAPFNTQTRYLSVSNDNPGGVAPINVSNMGELDLERIEQIGSANQGPISIANAGGMSVIGGDPKEVMPMISTGGSGSITLKTMSPLSIFGDIRNENGPILLEAGNGGVLKIGPDADVTSNSGTIKLLGGSVINDGKLFTQSGNINIQAPAVAGAGSYAAPGGVVTGLPSPVPTVTDCLGNSALAGCTAILKTALDACIVTPGGANCQALLPSLALCSVTPSTYGCSAVLPSVKLCTATPSTPGCLAVLPTISACTEKPATEGCSVVLPTLSACTEKPGTAGCSVVLPTLAQCVGSPTLQGCSAVLPTVAECASKPDTAGCSVTTPPVSAPPEKIAEAIKLTVDALAQSRDTVVVAANDDKKDDNKDDRAAAGAVSVQGEKKNATVKTYCN